MQYDFITIGGATEDITIYTSEGILIDNPDDILRQKLLAFEFGAKLKVDKAYSTFGGGAANAAVCLSYLKFKVAALVRIGNDERGKKILANFKKYGVDTSLVQIDKTEGTGFSFLLVGPGNEHVVFSNRAANTKLVISEKEKEALEGSKWIYMTSLSGKWKEVLKNIFSVSGPKVAWNPGHIQLHGGVEAIGRFLKKTAVLVANKDEAIELVVSDLEYRGKSHQFLNNVKNLLAILKSWGPEIVVVTSGQEGADAYDGKKFFHQDILKERKRVDTTGVGDAFGSTFVAGLEFFDGDIARAMYLGVKNTASVIGEHGAQNGLLNRREILKGLTIS
jgi:sugar/nucleoside kinase (ribokinase family)